MDGALVALLGCIAFGLFVEPGWKWNAKHLQRLVVQDEHGEGGESSEEPHGANPGSAAEGGEESQPVRPGPAAEAHGEPRAAAKTGEAEDTNEEEAPPTRPGQRFVTRANVWLEHGRETVQRTALVANARRRAATRVVAEKTEATLSFWGTLFTKAGAVVTSWAMWVRRGGPLQPVFAFLAARLRSASCNLAAWLGAVSGALQAAVAPLTMRLSCVLQGLRAGLAAALSSARCGLQAGLATVALGLRSMALAVASLVPACLTTWLAGVLDALGTQLAGLAVHLQALLAGPTELLRAALAKSVVVLRFSGLAMRTTIGWALRTTVPCIVFSSVLWWLLAAVPQGLPEALQEALPPGPTSTEVGGTQGRPISTIVLVFSTGAGLLLARAVYRYQSGDLVLPDRWEAAVNQIPGLKRKAEVNVVFLEGAVAVPPPEARTGEPQQPAQESAEMEHYATPDEPHRVQEAQETQEALPEEYAMWTPQNSWAVGEQEGGRNKPAADV